MSASYGELEKYTTLLARRDALLARLERCDLCPRECHVNRLRDERGFCETGRNARVARFCTHRGEEPPISGLNGSGTIFFSHCNLACSYCQNYTISHEGQGEERSASEIAEMMLALQREGSHNINFVSPSHVAPQILEALCIAVQKGFLLPLVYNSNGYDSLKTVHELENVIDIYLPDLKYSDDGIAQDLSGVRNYVSISRGAVKEMYRQVGSLQCDETGVAKRGLLIRHLVLPFNQSGSEDVLSFIARELSCDQPVSIMAQYHPCYKSKNNPKLSRGITEEEYTRVLDDVEECGLTYAYIQDLSSHDNYLPDFDRDHPFEEKQRD
jgi:putative pyruvate formate lyase activating enzyme